MEVIIPTKRAKLDDKDWNGVRNGYASKLLKEFYLDEKTADVFFICGTEKERIPAHKLILSKSNPVFHAMFFGSLSNGEADKVLPTTSSIVFKEFLQFFYCYEVNLSSDNIIDIMKLLHQYEMTECLERCGDCWANHMTIDDVCSALHWAIHFDLDELKKQCGRKISAYPQLVFKTLGFRTCDYVVIKHILQLDTLLCKEQLVLQSCLDWAQHAYDNAGGGEQCDENSENNNMDKFRQYLKDLLYEIRYKSMRSEELREVMDSRGELFSDAADYSDVIRLMSQSSELKTRRFNLNPRVSKFPWDENRILEQYLECSRSRQKFKFSEVIKTTLTSNRPILLGRLVCLPLNVFTDHFNFTIGVRITEKSITGNTKKVLFESGKGIIGLSDTIFDLSNEPIVIQPNFQYVLSFRSFHDTEYFIPNFRKEIKLNSETTIKLSGNHCPIRGFWFNLL